MFKVGDRVRILDDDQKGEIKEIHGREIIIINEFGFEERFMKEELIPDLDLKVGKVPKTQESEVKSKKKNSENPESKVVDLHIGELVDFYKNMSNFEMLQIQIQKIKEEMNLAMAQKRKKIVFIHGHGKGKLKREMMKVLKDYPKIEVYDASFRKYNGGATVVEFK